MPIIGNPGDMDTFYSDSPWANLDRNQRTWYSPILERQFRQSNTYSQFATFAQNLGAQNAKRMVISGLIGVHPNFDPIGLRQMWMPAMHVDSKEIEITFNRYGGKVAYDEYSTMINYWKQAQRQGLSQILRGELGQHMTRVIDMLVRNAYIDLDYKMYAGGASNFSQLGTSSNFLFEPGMVDDIHLGMQYRGVPGAIPPGGSTENQRTIVCVTTPGVIYDIQRRDENNGNVGHTNKWMYTNAYASPMRLLNYEVGTYRNVRFVQSLDAMLWNCGEVIHQTPITVPAQAGDGAGKQVDGAWTPGQIQSTPYIQLESVGDISVNDIVTIHTRRTTEFGVSGGHSGGGGVDYRDGRLHNLRVIAVDADANQITLEEPLMVDYTTDLTGSGAYGWVTLGRHVHATTFLGGPDGIVVGNGRPITVKSPPPVDDFEMMFRFSWNGYMGYQAYNPKVVETVFSAGTFRNKGGRNVQ